MLKNGQIKTIIQDKGFGFIRQQAGGEDVYFHEDAVKGEVDFDRLSVGMSVEYEVEESKKGLRAKYVKSLQIGQAAKVSEKTYRFLNPYNFVGFPKRPDPLGKEPAKPQPDLAAKLQAAGFKAPGQNADKAEIQKEHKILLGKCSPPPNDRYVGLTGEITCSLKTFTPLFISDAHEVYRKEKPGHSSHEFFKLNGQPAIPATSLRGMIRSVFETVTNSCLGVFDGKKYLQFRELPKYANSIKDNVGIVKKLAWKEQEGEIELCEYALVPAYYNKGNILTPKKNGKWKTGDYVFARAKPYGKHYKVTELAEQKDKLAELESNESYVEGWLKITGCGEGTQKRNEVLVFNPANHDSSGLVKFSYQVQEEYNTILKTQIELDGLTEVPKPKQLNIDDLVWVEIAENDNQHASRILRVQIPRTPYQNSIGDLLPDDYLKACANYNCLCPACRVFGWTYEKTDTEPPADKKIAYKGRVRFSHGIIEKNAGTLAETPLAILSSPKPTTTLFYLRPGQENDIPERWRSPGAAKGYDSDSNVLRGRKFYRHHNHVTESSYRRVDGRCDDQNRTVRDALAPGAEFGFSICFENLAPLELGALLWALEMDQKGYHRLGFAKPLGFGSVQIAVNTLKTLNPVKRYNSLHEHGWKVESNWSGKYVDNFKASLKVYWQADDFESISHVRDLRALLTARPNDPPIHYPRTAGIPDPEGKNFEWFMGNKRKENFALAEPTKDNGLPLLGKDGNIIK